MFVYRFIRFIKIKKRCLYICPKNNDFSRKLTLFFPEINLNNNSICYKKNIFIQLDLSKVFC